MSGGAADEDTTVDALLGGRVRLRQPASGYRAAIDPVLLAASVSLRFFRFGGVPQMVLGGIAAGFLLYVISKVTEDMSKAELMHPVAAAWLPVLVGGVTGFVALLYLEDG